MQMRPYISYIDMYEIEDCPRVPGFPQAARLRVVPVHGCMGRDFPGCPPHWPKCWNPLWSRFVAPALKEPKGGR